MYQFNNLNRELFDGNLEMEQVEPLPENLQQILDQYKQLLWQDEHRTQQYSLQQLSFQENIIFYFFSIILIPIVIFKSFFILQPNQVAVIECFGKPVAIKKVSGLNWYSIIFRKVFLIDKKIQSFELKNIKIPDKNGSTLDISVVINYTIQEPLMYLYGADNISKFIEGAVFEITRKIIGNFAYQNNEDQIDLLNDQKVISEAFMQMINIKLKTCGIKVVRMQFTELFYEKQLAQQLLQKQLALSKIEASEKLVEGATLILKDVKDYIEQNNMIQDKEIRNDLYEKLFLVISSDFGQKNKNKSRQKNIIRIQKRTRNLFNKMSKNSVLRNMLKNQNLEYYQLNFHKILKIHKFCFKKFNYSYL